MVDFAPGMRTIIRDEEWMIKKIETNSLGNKTLYCVGVSPLVKDREAIFLADLEQIQVVDPAEVKLVADHSPFYKRALLYLESQWRQQIPTDSNLHIGHRAAMDLMPYQLDPAKLSLQRPRQRILIADTVGLGKTLEAGILMSELIARGKGKRILVVTVKSMMTQFQKEMWNRFTIPLVRLDSNRIQKIRANLPSNYNPFFYYDKTIISIDTLKRDVEYRTHLENAYWDIIVIDEKRLGFQKMIADAVDGKIDLILTKSISRFGRNIVDILDNLRTLSALNPPVSVEFETEGITYTGDGRNNLLISLLAALAEMESQQKSEAIKAGIRWRMAEGIYKFSVQNTLGFYRDHFGRLVIEPTEARIVEYIYESCLEGATPAEIAAALTEQGIKSPMGNDLWSAGTIRSILQNEKYCGDALMQKTYTKDFRTHKSVKNTDLNMYFKENHHTAITVIGRAQYVNTA